MIEAAFDRLQSELQEQISEKMIKARSALLENFDESVKEKLRDNLAQSRKNLDQFEKRLKKENRLRILSMNIIWLKR